MSSVGRVVVQLSDDTALSFFLFLRFVSSIVEILPGRVDVLIVALLLSQVATKKRKSAVVL